MSGLSIGNFCLIANKLFHAMATTSVCISQTLHVRVLSALRHPYSGLSCFLMIRSGTLFDRSAERSFKASFHRMDTPCFAADRKKNFEMQKQPSGENHERLFLQNGDMLFMMKEKKNAQ